MKMIIALATSILLAGCGGINQTGQTNDLPALPNEFQVGQNALEMDTLQEYDFPVITEEQRMTLHQKSGVVVPDSTLFIGVREIEKKRTLEAYLVPSREVPNDFEVYLVTRGSDGWGIHCMIMGHFHTIEHQGPIRIGVNRFYTHDSSITFDGTAHIVRHHTLTLTSLILKGHRLNQLWRVEWDDDYKIDDKGYITFTGERETFRTDSIDDPVIEEYMSGTRFK